MQFKSWHCYSYFLSFPSQLLSTVSGQGALHYHNHNSKFLNTPYHYIWIVSKWYPQLSECFSNNCWVPESSSQGSLWRSTASFPPPLHREQLFPIREIQIFNDYHRFSNNSQFCQKITGDNLKLYASSLELFSLVQASSLCPRIGQKRNSKMPFDHPPPPHPPPTPSANFCKGSRPSRRLIFDM